MASPLLLKRTYGKDIQKETGALHSRIREHLAALTNIPQCAVFLASTYANSALHASVITLTSISL